MSLKKQKKKSFFISIIHGKEYENHRIVINERVFKLNDIKKWRLYLKLILQYVNYLCEINDKDMHLLLQDIIKQVKSESKQFKRKMGYELGDWGRF